MMKEIKHPTPEPLFFIAHNNGSVYHYNKMMTANSMGTGQPIVEEFRNINAWANQLKKYGITIDKKQYRDP